MPDEFFDVGQRYHIGFATEADRVARGAAACGAANPVHVIFGVLRQVVVDDAFHVRNVQAARRDIRSDQHGEFAALKLH